jgi:hypothetical protein
MSPGIMQPTIIQPLQLEARACPRTIESAISGLQAEAFALVDRLAMPYHFIVSVIDDPVGEDGFLENPPSCSQWEVTG